MSDRLRQLDGFVDGRVRRDVAQVNELIRAEAEQFPDFDGDAIPGPIGMGVQQRVEAAAATEGAVDEFGGQPAVGGRQWRPAEGVVESFPGKAACVEQDIQREPAGRGVG